MVSLGTQRGKVQKMSPKRKVVIIGAGPAGLTAGYILLKQSDCFDVVILEEESMSGGISRTVNHNGNRMDLGGHRFFSKVPEVNALWGGASAASGSSVARRPEDRTQCPARRGRTGSGKI